jgi:hypothetical protein
MRRQQIKEQGSKIKKTIEKAAGMLPIGSGTAHDTKAANQSACPATRKPPSALLPRAAYFLLGAHPTGSVSELNSLRIGTKTGMRDGISTCGAWNLSRQAAQQSRR